MRALIAGFVTPRRQDELGATSTEYALLVAFLVFAMIAGATLFGTSLSQAFTDLGDTLSAMDDNF